MDYLVETYPTSDTNLAYDEDENYGNENAGVGKVVSVTGAGLCQIGANNAKILGELIEVRRDGMCSVKVFAMKTKLQSSGANACTVGSPILSAGSGQVKNQPADTTGADTGLGLGRGLVTQIIGTQAAGSLVEVQLF